ncbi:MAG: 4-hydroxy-tetrahydrodipicolinate synthase [Clostridia bacterium]
MTPFCDNGIDYAAFARFIEFQLSSGIDALVVCGTTGESSTLNDGEKREVIKFVVKQARGRVPVIAGTGSNSTACSVDLSKYACSVGADAILAVTPYYNKATQNGLFEHYKKIAESIDKPVILYNVPSRTGVNIEPQTYLRLSAINNISAIKEASCSMSDVVRTFSLVFDKLYIYSGNDDLFLPFLSLGASGIISVVSNIFPKTMKKIYTYSIEGKSKKSAEIMLELIPIINLLFSEPNPIPVKAAASYLGYCENLLRLPLTPMNEKSKTELVSLVKKQLQNEVEEAKCQSLSYNPDIY